MVKHLLRSAFLLIVFSMFATGLLAQVKDKAKLQQMVESRHFLFVAQMALPMGGHSRVLNSNYDLRISGDSIFCYLPYYGRAYASTPGTVDRGLDFTSTKLEYDQKPAKKGGWTVTVKPLNQNIVQNMVFLITESGSASLQVTCRDRQSISFDGYIDEKKK